MILLIILPGCSKQDSLPAKDTLENKPTVAFSNNDVAITQQEQHSGIYKPSVPYTQGEELNKVANNLITMYLEHYKNTSNEKRIWNSLYKGTRVITYGTKEFLRMG